MKKQIKMTIEDMQCPNCAMILESIEDRLAGVLLAEASYRNSQLVVTYDDQRVSAEGIAAEVRRLGYRVGAVQMQG